MTNCKFDSFTFVVDRFSPDLRAAQKMFACQAFQKISRVVVGELQRPLGIHQVRWGRRTCKKMPWQVQRKISPFWSQKELTVENRQFLKDSHLEIIPKHRPLINSNLQINEWDTNTYRTGVLALKIGVIPQWTTEGQKFYCTMLQVLDNHVIKCSDIGKTGKRSKVFINGKQGMKSLVIGALSTTTEKFTKMYCGLFNEAGVLPKRKLTRFYVSPEGILEPGTPLDASHFRVGQYVDAQAKTIGHGFQGVVKRWKFKGGPASHGTTKWHRRPGNIGCGRGRSKVMKGKKMPGHMGMEWSTTRGLKIWRINTLHNVLYVHGQAVPGPNQCYVRLYDTLVEEKREKMLNSSIPVPTDLQLPKDNQPEEIFDSELFQLSESFSSISVDK